MPKSGLEHFLGRVRGDPFAYLNINRGKVKVKEMLFQHEIVIEADCFFSYRLHLPKFDTVHLDVEVLSGGEIDVLTMNDYNFGRYARCETFIYIVSGSILNIRKVSNIFIAQDEGVHHIVLDNTYYPENGARPNRAIDSGKARVKISAKTHSPLQMDMAKPMKLWS